MTLSLLYFEFEEIEIDVALPRICYSTQVEGSKIYQNSRALLRFTGIYQERLTCDLLCPAPQLKYFVYSII